MAYRPRDITNRLEHKFGFTAAVGHSSDHHWYELRFPDLPPILTKVSHSRKEIGRKLESKIAHQLKVRNAFFRGMMDCRHELDDYERQVRENPYPPFDVRF